MDDEIEKGPWFPQEMDKGKRQLVRNLVLAAKNGEEDTVRQILESGEVDVDSKYRWETALMVAARSNNITLCNTLLKFGADCNVPRVMQQTALWIASYHGNLAAMELMIQTRKCSQINLDNTLRRCVNMNFLHGCDTLLRAGADIEATDSMGLTSLHVAAGITEDNLRPKSDHWKYQNQDTWRLYHATNLDICELLIMWQADVNALDSTQATPLHYACETGNEDICKMLIENGALLNIVGGTTMKTPLHVAVSKDFPNIVRLLLENPKIKPNMVDADGDTPLISAIQLHKKECVRIFLGDERWADFMSVICKTNSCKTDVVDTPMRQLIRQMPDMACLVMNKCIDLSSHKDPKNPDFTARFNFAFLDDTYTCSYWKANDETATTCFVTSTMFPRTPENSTPASTLGRKEKTIGFTEIPKGSTGQLRRKHTIIDPVTRPESRGTETAPLCDSKCFNCSGALGNCSLARGVEAYCDSRRVLLNNHPLFVAYHEKKNSVLCHPLAIALIDYKWKKMARYSFYGGLFMYIIFVGLLTAQVMIRHEGENGNASAYQNNSRNSHADQITVMDVITPAVCIICLLGIITEIFSMANEFPSYVLAFRNWVDLAIYIASMATVILSSEETAPGETRVMKPMQSICIFAAWFNIMLTLRQFPVIGIFFIMFTRILKNSLIVLVVFFPLILGFAFTYTILLEDAMPLFKIGKSIATILIMLSGEVEFVDTMTEKGQMNQKIKQSGMAITLYVFFIVLMVICLLNLLVGLAVSDVETLHRESKAEMMSLRAEKVMTSEYYLPFGTIRRRAACGCLRIKPNKPSKLCISKDSNRLRLGQRIKAWFNVLEFQDTRLTPAFLMSIKRVERPDNQYEAIRKEIFQIKSQLDTTNILSPKIARGDSSLSNTRSIAEVPGARVLKKSAGIAKEISPAILGNKNPLA